MYRDFKACAGAAVLALGAALSFTGTANAAVANFEGQAAFRCDFAAEHDGGLTFTNSFAFCFYSPASPADFPTAPPSTVLGSGFSDTNIVTDNASTFNLDSVDLAFGPFNHNGATSDTTLVTGFLFGGGTISTTLTVGYAFQTYNFAGWNNLTSVTFGQLAANSEYLAFDNVTYNSGAIPEPATWGLMLVGFGGLGSVLRRRRAAVTA